MFSRAGAGPSLWRGHTVCTELCARPCGSDVSLIFLSRDICNWGISKCLSRFLLHPPLSHSQGNNAAAVTGRHCVWLEDIQALTGETFRMDKKPDPANWEYKSLYRGDIARCVGGDGFLRSPLLGRGLLSALSSLSSDSVSASPQLPHLRLCGALSIVSCSGLHSSR